MLTGSTENLMTKDENFLPKKPKKTFADILTLNQLFQYNLNKEQLVKSKSLHISLLKQHTYNHRP